MRAMAPARCEGGGKPRPYNIRLPSIVALNEAKVLTESVEILPLRFTQGFGSLREGVTAKTPLTSAHGKLV